MKDKKLCDTAPFRVSVPDSSLNTDDVEESTSNKVEPPAKAARRQNSTTLDSFFSTPSSSSAAASKSKSSDGDGKDEKVVWYWRRDDGGWEPYSDVLSRKIEAAFKSPDSDEYRVVIDKKRYVDLSRMKQRHHVSEDLERDIKREVL